MVSGVVVKAFAQAVAQAKASKWCSHHIPYASSFGDVSRTNSSVIMRMYIDAENGGAQQAKTFTLKKNAMTESQALEILKLSKDFTPEQLEQVGLSRQN